MAIFTLHFIALDISTYAVKCLLLQAIIIGVSLYGCDKLPNFSTNAKKSELLFKPGANLAS